MFESWVIIRKLGNAAMEQYTRIINTGGMDKASILDYRIKCI